MTDRKRRPGIRQIGKVETRPDGTTWITGWGLTPCLHNCPCHRDPASNELVIREIQGIGLLGLRQFFPCDCCQPWTGDELAAVVADLAYVVSTLEGTA